MNEEAGIIASLAPQAVLTDVAYLPLAGAAKVGIPAIAMCSLNWADIFTDFCGYMDGAAAIIEQIQGAYLQAESFWKLAPAMPMTWLSNQKLLGPVADVGLNRRADLSGKFEIKPGNKIVLASMGGIPMDFSTDSWPEIPDVTWLVPQNWKSMRSDMIAMESLGIGFADLLASSDILLTKPGYGAFVEAACAGVAVLYMRREAWSEQEYLIGWLNENGNCHELQAGQLSNGDFGQELKSMLDGPRPVPVIPTGVQEAASGLADLLGCGC